MASIITATNSSGLTTSADNSGVLQLASGTGNLVTIPSVTGTAMVSGNMPAFSAYAGANQNITAATWTKININTEEFDTASCFDTSTYRFTPNVAGYYQVNGQVFYGFGTVSRMIIAIYKNGSLAKLGNDIAAVGYRITVSSLVYMNGTTDYLELYTYYSGSGSGTGGNGSVDTYFQASMVRGA